jgi:hypothetical protein
MCVIRVGGETAECLSITVIGHRSPFLSVDVEVAANGFRGTVGGSLIDYELHAFRDQLARLLDTCQGTATYDHHLDWFTLAIEAGGRGQVIVNGTLRDSEFSAGHNRLIFHLDLDQTYLRPLLDGLNQVIERYPSTSDQSW